MAIHARDEVEAAFRVYWQTGAVGEDRDAWCDLLTEDAVHHEHVLGRRQGREEIRRWIRPTMERVPDPDHPGRRTRLNWPASPAWASPAGPK
jgi:hypothetical protein